MILCRRHPDLGRSHHRRKAEHVEQIPDCRHVGRNIRIIGIGLGIRQVVTAAVREPPSHLARRLSKRAAALKPPPKNAQLMFFSLSASPIVRSVDGGTAVPAVISATLMAPFS